LSHELIRRLHVEIATHHQDSRVCVHTKLYSVFVEVDGGVLDLCVALVNKHKVLNALVSRHCQLGRELFFHLFSHMLQVNSGKLLKKAFSERRLLLAAKLDGVVAESKIEIFDSHANVLGGEVRVQLDTECRVGQREGSNARL
jgi:hypothetical protein